MNVLERFGQRLTLIDGFGEDGTALTEFVMTFLAYMMVVVMGIQVAIWAFAISATQFAVWEGCRRGAAVYQPPPPDGTGEGGLRSQLEVGLSEEAAGASFAALDRIEEVLGWLPLTRNYSHLRAEVVEEDVLPGEEGRREIMASVRVEAPVLVPIRRNWFPEDALTIERSCRLRLARYYSY